MVFRTIINHAESNSRYWYYKEIVGHEMIAKDHYDYNHNTQQNERKDIWLFRSYLDGTAFYRKQKTHSILYRYPTSKNIDEVVEKYFYTDTEIVDHEFAGRNSHYPPMIVVLKRKPLSDYTRRVALEQETSLGDYLVRKYNIGVEHDANATV
jgi:hypothetical protein